jgi:prefoldin subunit 5
MPGYPAPAAGAYGQDTGWQLVLSAGAKRLVQVILAFGLLLTAGEGFGVGVVVNAAIVRDREVNQLNTEIAQHNAAVARLNAAITSEQQATGQVHNAITEVSDAHDTLNSALNNSVNQANACATVSCFDSAAVPAANGLTAFGRALHAVSIPAGSSEIANRLVADSNSTAQGWTKMSHAASFTDYENDATGAENTGGKFDNDYSALVKSLGQVESTLQNQAAALDSQALTLNNGVAALNRRAAQLNVAVGVRSASEA